MLRAVSSTHLVSMAAVSDSPASSIPGTGVATLDLVFHLCRLCVWSATARLLGRLWPVRTMKDHQVCSGRLPLGLYSTIEPVGRRHGDPFREKRCNPVRLSISSRYLLTRITKYVGIYYDNIISVPLCSLLTISCWEGGGYGAWHGVKNVRQARRFFLPIPLRLGE